MYYDVHCAQMYVLRNEQYINSKQCRLNKNMYYIIESCLIVLLDFIKLNCFIILLLILNICQSIVFANQFNIVGYVTKTITIYFD